MQAYFLSNVQVSLYEVGGQTAILLGACLLLLFSPYLYLDSEGKQPEKKINVDEEANTLVQ